MANKLTNLKGFGEGDPKPDGSKSKALKSKFSFHDIRSNRHRDAEYSEVRSSIKNSYSKKSSGIVRKMAQDLKPNTSEAIPAKGGYYSRVQ